ncbi:hypothetical protein SCORR_v1c10350 (plasmid) [Spiroplasma corruscae]|uniref:Uncharacterized protein n=1 Tax=Spiroplasma corruscae TaxID=216934 RepID=A0A222EQL5_9MOLU|nr:hypothetical protein [Spiroplasma corruscae]ASP28807.1 hypothetical protein SCORR_v1c10350 [Spiroplasma corruscae]
MKLSKKSKKILSKVDGSSINFKKIIRRGKYEVNLDDNESMNKFLKEYEENPKDQDLAMIMLMIYMLDYYSEEFKIEK